MRVVIGDDEALIRRGLEMVLTDGGFDVVGVAVDAPGLLSSVAEHRPDLVITDIRMPPGNADDGLAAALRIRRTNPEIAVVVLSQYVQRSYAEELVSLGTERVGYLLKQRIADVERFRADLYRVAAGGTALDPEVIAIMVGRSRASGTGVAGLTPRQQEVLGLVAEGRSNASIAGALYLSEKAVVQHVSRIYDSLGLDADDADAHRRVQAVLQYLNHS